MAVERQYADHRRRRRDRKCESAVAVSQGVARVCRLRSSQAVWLCGEISRRPSAVCDRTRMPVRNRAAPVVAMVAVSHHLIDAKLDEALGEIARVQPPAGTFFFFFDALLVPERVISRFLWARDRGAHRRTAVDILARLQGTFQIVKQFESTLWHRSLACRCRSL